MPAGTVPWQRSITRVVLSYRFDAPQLIWPLQAARQLIKSRICGLRVINNKDTRLLNVFLPQPVLIII